MIRLSIIVPTLNEAQSIGDMLESLQSLRARGAEVIIVDGGSDDKTVDMARPWSDTVLVAPRGRASQMNAGAMCARGQLLLFLHADTRLPPDACDAIFNALATKRVWGRFDVRIASTSRLLRVVQFMMNWRSRWSGIATGDQAIFVQRDIFNRVGGYPDIALMEDIALSKKLKQLGRPACLADKVVTSGRRWERRGVMRTIFLMWRLRLDYALGAEPADLAQRYGCQPHKH